MGMTPNDFFFAFVMGNYYDFCDNKDSIRHGFNAAVAASHLADHCYEYYYNHKNPKGIPTYRSIGQYLEYLSKKSQYFNDIRSIANAYKHLYQQDRCKSHGSKSHVTVSSAGSIETVKTPVL